MDEPFVVNMSEARALSHPPRDCDRLRAPFSASGRSAPAKGKWVFFVLGWFSGRPPPLWSITIWTALVAVGIVVLLIASAGSVLERVGVGLLLLGVGATVSGLIRLSNARSRR